MLNTSAIQDYLRSKPVRRAYLFGSQARGEETQNSDIDILLDLDESVDLFEFARIKNQLEELLHQSVDLISMKGISPRIRPFIDADKILIYER